MLRGRLSHGALDVKIHLINSGFIVSLTLGPISRGRSRNPGWEFPFPFLPSSSNLTAEKVMMAWMG